MILMNGKFTFAARHDGIRAVPASACLDISSRLSPMPRCPGCHNGGTGPPLCLKIVRFRGDKPVNNGDNRQKMCREILT
jgi:hypothetical protein